MSYARSLRLLAGTLTATVALGTLGATAAQARPVKPGGVTGLTASVTPQQGSSASASYAISSSWNAAAGATKYRVALTKSGTTLTSSTVTTTSWSPTVTSSPGDASLAVTPVANHRKGATVRVTVHFADVMAPRGTYTSDWTGADATITQTELTDDSGSAGVTRVVDWGDGTTPASWTTGTTVNHSYAGLGRYLPTVTLTDAAANEAVVPVPAIVIGDTTAPTGAFSAGPGAAWAGFTAVTLSQSALNDDYTPNGAITRTVDWGDTTTSSWSAGQTITHVYPAAGTFSPKVTITDESGNAAEVTTSDVTVKADVVAPLLRLLLPTSRTHSVKTWKTLRGKATDAPGTGVKQVSLRAVEKRGTAWYGYRPATKRWVRAATKAGAFKRSRAFSLTTNARHRWSATLAGLRKGTLVYKVSAVDQVKNSSRTLTHKATLTKP
jgi:hypothetical protein